VTIHPTIFAGAHGEEVVRDIVLDPFSGTYFTCGEDGLVKAWRDDERGRGESRADHDVEMADVDQPKRKKRRA
jgi:WD repeat-containing protein 89